MWVPVGDCMSGHVYLQPLQTFGKDTTAAGHVTSVMSVAVAYYSSFANLSVQFSSRWYFCPRKSPFVLHPISHKFPQRHLWNVSSVHLIDDGLSHAFREDHLALPLSTLLLTGTWRCKWILTNSLTFVFQGLSHHHSNHTDFNIHGNQSVF